MNNLTKSHQLSYALINALYTRITHWMNEFGQRTKRPGRTSINHKSEMFKTLCASRVFQINFQKTNKILRGFVLSARADGH